MLRFFKLNGFMMKHIIIAAGLLVAGCQDSAVVRGDAGCLQDAHSEFDLAPAPAKCAAAQGLSGDVLLCVDFDKVAGISDPALAGWNFSLNCDDGAKWDILDSKLQLNASFVGQSRSCKFSIPPFDLNDLDKNKYRGITLSILHTLDLSESDYMAQILLSTDDPPRRLLTQMTGYQKRQISSFNLAKNDLPQGESVYQFLFKLITISKISGRKNWNIESIAIIGNET